MNGKVITGIFVVMICFYSCTLPEEKQHSAVPDAKELGRSFGKHDEKAFVSPPKVYHPETWFHFIGGNVSAKGITADLKTWKDLDLSPDGKAFSGTVTYTTSFNVDNLNSETNYTLDLGRVEMIAAVSLKGKPLRTLWAPPYHLDISGAVSKGENHLSVDVTSTLFTMPACPKISAKHGQSLARQRNRNSAKAGCWGRSFFTLKIHQSFLLINFFK